MVRDSYTLQIRNLGFLVALLQILSFSSSSCGQDVQKPVSKDQALKEVKISSVNGWKEVMSGQGRCRILFPGEPTIVENGDDVAGLQGFKLITPEKHWVSYWIDFKDRTAGDDTQLRNAYRQSVESITKRSGAKVLSQTDVRLNGRLGSEFIIDSARAVSYMRAFQIRQRLYTLSVDVQKTGEVSSAVPQDVREFFDSFTFWD
jgi:hypothetical protein